MSLREHILNHKYIINIIVLRRIIKTISEYLNHKNQLI